jgi:hypothetical protein
LLVDFKFRLKTFVNVATNGVLNLSSVQDSKSVQMKSSAKGLFSSSVSATTKAIGVILDWFF